MIDKSRFLIGQAKSIAARFFHENRIPVRTTAKKKERPMRSPMIAGVKFVSIPVRDQERSLRFYTEALGFEILTDQEYGKGRRWIELKIPGAETNVVLFTAPGQEGWIGQFSNVVFWTHSVEKTYEVLKSRGVEFVQPPQKEPWGSSALFKDVDGNTFCLSCK